MPKVSEIIAQKGNTVRSVSPEATAMDAALLMTEHGIGSVVIIENDELRGIFTERDILRRVVAERRDPAKVRIADVMTSRVIFCEPDAELDEARMIMKQQKIRHMPVVDADGKLHGMLSIGDLNAYQADTQEVAIKYLHEYLFNNGMVQAEQVE